MNIVIAGGTGFLGAPLVKALLDDGHDLVVLTRSERAAGGSDRLRYLQWTPDGAAGPWATALDGAHAIINLAGEPIAGTRWTPARKQEILESRVRATRSLVAGMAKAGVPPSTFVSGSAVGYYGRLGDELADENRGPGNDFLATVCIGWEAEAMRAAASGARVAFLRTGIVLERDGGALPKMLPPFWFGAGGTVGSGRQYWPWIHRRDWIDLVRFVLRTPGASGPFNLTAPTPVRNAEFAKALGRALRRPSLVPTPGFALRLMLGEMADALLLSGQRAVPARAERLGYTFAFGDLDAALRKIFGQ